MRDWARRDGSVRAQVDAADAARLDAVQQMFVWQGYDLRDADARARILYYMQLGYHALEVRETLETRLGRVEAYITGFSGRDADARVVADFAAKVRAIGAAPDAP